MSNSKRVSQLTVKTSLADADVLTGVSNSANYQVSWGTIKSLLGVTGTLSSTGALLGTPVLTEPTSGNYFIRKMENGAGVMFSVSGDGGIKAKWNITQDATGVPLTANLTDVTPDIASLVAGTGMVISKSGNAITVSATGELNPNNTVIVNQESDFPDQTESAITLKAGRIYQISASLTTAKYFIVEDGAKITGNNFFSPVLTYSGTGSMFVGSDASFLIEQLRLDHPNSQGFDFTDTVGGQKIFWMKSCRVLSGTKFGTFNNMQSNLFDDSSCLDMDQGATFTGVDNVITSFNKFYIGSTNASFEAVNIGTAISQNWEFDDLIAIGPSGSKGIVGAAASANVPLGIIATVSGCNFAGVTTPLTGISERDIRWQFAKNSGIPDSKSDALISVTNNATETSIATINTPVLLNATFTASDLSRFSHNGTGRLTYTAEIDERLPIDVSVSVTMAGGGDKLISAYIALNGTPIAATKTQTTANSSSTANINIPWQLEFSNGDYIEIYLDNTVDTVNIIGKNATIRVN